MSELHTWLSTQHHGLQTYKSLKQKLIGRASADPGHAALYRLLASMIDPYIDSFDEEPLPVDVADEVFTGTGSTFVGSIGTSETFHQQTKVRPEATSDCAGTG